MKFLKKLNLVWGWEGNKMNGNAPLSLGKGGLKLCVEETKKFDKSIRDSYEQIGLEVYGVKHPPRVAVFAYGSPGRRELIGGDSDADIFLIEKERTEKLLKDEAAPKK